MNILIFHGDEHNSNCLGCYGNSQIITPNLDRLSKDSIVYTQHYCAYPVCTPSRYSLLCGRYTHAHGGWGNHCTLAHGIPTFPRSLKDNGYKTVAIGKMHFTPTYLDVGFDKMLLSEQDGVGRMDDDYHTMLKENGLIDDIDIIDQRSEYRQFADNEYYSSFGAQVSNLNEKYHTTTWIGENALEEVSTWHDQQNHLLMMGFVKPHHPFDPNERFVKMYEGMDIKPLKGYTDKVPDVDRELHRGYFDNATLDVQTLKKATLYYYASITQMDEQIGRIIDKLKEIGEYDNTMIIYTSDHGDYMGFHHQILKGGYMYDAVTKIPLIIKYPKGCAKVGTNECLSSNIDIAGEILKTAGVEVDVTMSNNDIACPSKDYVICEENRGHLGHFYMIRNAKYKLLLSKDKKHTHLFDMQKDPLELNDVVEDKAYAPIFEEMRNKIYQEMTFNSLYPIYLNENEVTVEGAFRGEKLLKHRKEMTEYFKKTSSVGEKIE